MLTGWVVALGSWAFAAHAQAPPLEYQVKASYLYNFARFIDWPNDVLDSGTFNLCVVGAERFGRTLDQLAGERIDGHELVIRRLERVAAAHSARCHMLFIGTVDAAAQGPIAAERGVLTIGEAPGFVERGGMINLVEVRGRIHFQINHKAAKQAGLVVSSRLLDLAMKR